MSSVVLEDGLAESVLTDLKEFLATEDWYINIGIPYRRGYLLYGPPGCGKTSLILALAAELDMSINCLNLSGFGLTDEILCNAVSSAGTSSILVLEDVDSAFQHRAKNADDKTAVTFSGLLNALDGVATQDGRVVIMTTNHIEKLDPALIRPGRVDVKVLLDKATKDQARRLFERFFPEHKELVVKFSGYIDDREYSPAELQKLMLDYKDSPEALIESMSKKKTAYAVGD